jgi:hypothetical protein
VLGSTAQVPDLGFRRSDVPFFFGRAGRGAGGEIVRILKSHRITTVLLVAPAFEIRGGRGRKCRIGLMMGRNNLTYSFMSGARLFDVIPSRERLGDGSLNLPYLKDQG